MRRMGARLFVAACALGAVMLFGGIALGQSPFPLSGSSGFGRPSDSLSESFRGAGLTSVRMGVFYGGGEILVDDIISAGQNTALLFNDFSPFVHHRKTDLKDAYFSAAIGIGTRETEFLTFSLETNLGSTTRFNQYTDAGNFPIDGVPQFRWYRAALGVLALGNDVGGLITLDNHNRYWAFDLCGKLPIAAPFDVLGGYKGLWIRSHLDPFSALIGPGPGGGGPGTYPVLPGQEGWIPAWRDTDLTSATQFDMYQTISWHGPFIGLRMSNISVYGFEWSFDTRLYPWLFGKYTFAWNGAWLDPSLGFTPGIFGSQSTDASGNRRWGADVDVRCRRSLRDLLTVQFEARYSYAWMSGSTVEYQTEGNIYPGFGTNISQDTAETLTITQQLWTLGGSLEVGF